ncbi:uncharacterized protein LOC132563196 [Ylistrum balloti]|uniref:uncharacterized protein LOC132563196 n=1 Tax=Ylistrum balloti TaxID=509963 RepID=UPI00290583D3|nr:uncharacterized protein LOC132563196 [Ylistrum balloti]
MASTNFFMVVLVVVFMSLVTNGQKPCCSPEKWTAHLLQKTGAYNAATSGASKRNVSSHIYYDYTLKKLAIFSDVRNTTFNSSTYLQRIMDFNKGVEWRINGKNCTRHQTTEPMPQPCFLDGADFFGYHNMAEMPVEVWFKDDNKGHTSRTTMSREPCVLVTETTRSMGPGLGKYNKHHKEEGNGFGRFCINRDKRVRS